MSNQTVEAALAGREKRLLRLKLYAVALVQSRRGRRGSPSANYSRRCYMAGHNAAPKPVNR